MKSFDVQVRGAGVVGRCLALALAREGLRVALRPAPPRAEADEDGEDVRAYALNPASVELLRGLKVWDALPAHAATAVLDMHVRGDAPAAAIDFSAWQACVGALAWITDTAVLEGELAAALRFAPHVTLIDPSADDVQAPLTALCEGQGSTARSAHGVSFDRVEYGHRAIAARLTSDRPHRGLARQWFGAPDVLALLPFDAPQPQRSYALVWSVPEARAAELLALDAAAFEAELMRASGGEAGTLALASARAAWPLAR
ncbi:MAG TPA: 2-octaprenyl-3-methyl-6-methoxy-1,4-benzoquinol hydroxylase, partial [Burkholderiaceae bacterium]|nr:2-octaprenyl-3-methyl-6-methoxy-1,4-benzoquinol hydroxylase [Burkholderiaceae bacterium]